MASPYAQPSSSGGSAYAQPNTSTSSPYAGSPAAAKPSGGGGFWGDLAQAAHWTGQKADLAARDLKAIPGGIVQIAKATVVHQIEHPITPTKDQPAIPLVKAMAKQTVQSVEHPLRDPFQTLLTVAPVASGIGSGIARAGAVGEAARVGDLAGAAKAVVARPVTAPRLLDVGEAKVPLHPSDNPAIRAVQGIYDKGLQRAVNKNPEGRVASHAMRRVGGSLQETARYQQRMRAAIAGDLQAAGRELGRVKGPHAPAKVAQAALRLTSENSTPEEAAAFHAAQAAKGVGVKENLQLAKLYQDVAKRGILTRDAAGNVAVDAAKAPQLAAVDAKLAAGQTQVDQILREHGLMTPEGIKARNDLPAVIRRAGIPEEARAGSVYAAQGRGYVPYKVLEPKASGRQVSGSLGPVVGAPKSPISAKAFTGAGLEHGLVPDNTTRLFAQHWRNVIKYVNTDQFRRMVATTGSQVRRTSRDVLIRLPDEKAGKIPAEIENALGRKTLTTAELAGHDTAMHSFLDRIVPGRADNFATDKAQMIGAPAPPGYKWVDRNVLGDLGSTRPRLNNRLTRSADTINSAVTAATVYFKIGHVGTRFLTNAAANIIQGSATPLQIAKSVELWKTLDRGERLRALAASGGHGFAAMPHEGANLVGRIAATGANWWAKHADAPFRFNSIAYEARKAGYNTPAKFKQLLDHLENPKGLAPAEAAKVDRIAKEANRAAIAYDRLNETERNFINRAVWFYPWIKGATSFAARTFMEHPYKSAALAQTAAYGRNVQGQELGNVPSYEAGLFKVGEAGGLPLVSDFSTFSPFATPGDVVNAAARPKEAAGFLNPVYSTLVNLIQGLNATGQPTTHPYSAAVSNLFSPTPEAQILNAYLNRGKPTNTRLFPQNPAWAGTHDSVLRALLGPAVPRRFNPAAGRKDYQTELKGR